MTGRNIERRDKIKRAEKGKEGEKRRTGKKMFLKKVYEKKVTKSQTLISAHVWWLPWWLRQWRICLQCKRPGFNPWVGKMPWKRTWQPTPVLLPGEFPWTEESDTTEWLRTAQLPPQTIMLVLCCLISCLSWGRWKVSGTSKNAWEARDKY